ncbi:phospho-sugar mutase [Curtobacterium flaccumfaciens]|uniref:phospho-sugar mutase n=1 Tax=Curtobacterium flaccumfaciens TaxID=2035 RepID=UPI000FFE94F8|nr:phospho-sugar mutase [Curtobacterium flaccumfaciens]MCS0645570.1 phospho-sugar mutase [Curtobacterium flaccumfaciens pv. flaccumfaciens]MCS6525807.1 phospho-sugar mutase [Curtobacterium flaccumfaciens pv. flaccumfaciens]MCS6529389.1 phospho-sugar mutase [Curtobacterium flaccumfaciens pv. flaccumfaciens]NUU10349.1 phospho-sugar mutase [Curtobacterium flaccumfaciens]RXF84306.1 phosphomannomutase [Curtobacterium flaccumfaciens pv. flaccumfaciens]
MKLDLDQVLGTARAWLAQDPDPETRDELAAAIDAAADGDGPAVRALAERFDGRLQFGTAGLRAELGWGPLRMNRVVVTQAAAGLARFLIDTGRSRSVVIGYDGRVNSDVFARDSAEVMRGLGLEVTLLPSALPTPVLAFAVRHLDVGAGVMVTASHNPPRDNGYKVYLGQDDDGSQIVPPVDGEIADAIDAVAAGSVTDLPRGTDYTVATSALVDAYVAATAAIVPAPVLGVDEQPKVVYTAMHGVGWETARAVFVAAGFASPTVVPEQIEPDGAFPTVSFPNPEEPGAMDLAIARGLAVGADLVIANDPDADRLALAIPTAADAGAPSYRRLSGNEVGWLLGWRAAARASESGATGTLAASIVSSPALARVAARHGLEYRDTLTGFKWVSRVPELLFGYEEALGYLVDPSVVRDKDGISAALELLSLADELAASGSTIADHLEAFAAEFGAFASGQVATRVDDLSRIGEIMASLRSTPPSTLGGLDVHTVTDYADGVAGFPPSDILRYDLSGDARVIVRPSGTEPKVKVYIDTVADTPAEAQRLVDALAESVRPLVS